MEGEAGPTRATGRRELLPAALLGGAAGAASVVLGLAGAVAGGETRVLDERLLLAFRDPADPARPVGPPWLVETGRDFTALGSNGVLAFLVLGAVLVLALARRRAEAVLLLATAAGALALNALLKHWYERPRPELVPHAARVFTASFPSSHATMSAAVFLTAGVLLARARPEPRAKLAVAWLSACLVLLVGLSRVYLGVHWPSDVAAGWALGAGWAAACWAVALRLGRAWPIRLTGGQPSGNPRGPPRPPCTRDPERSSPWMPPRCPRPCSWARWRG